MSVTYQLATGGNIILSHGYQLGPLMQVVEFNSEISTLHTIWHEKLTGTLKL